jgi:hypothetical protein
MTNKAKITVDLGVLEQSCFVIMPFNPLFKLQYDRVIRPSIDESGLRCVRGDEIYSKPRIVDDIWKSLRASRLVIAELTGKNPNVFYEVGLAQAIGKPVIILTRDENDVPFDLKSLRYLFYDVQNPNWGEDLKSQLKLMIAGVLKEEGLNSYLEGISANEELHFPALRKSPASSKSKENLSLADVSGVWRHSYGAIGRGIMSGTKALSISQAEDALSGTEINTYFYQNSPERPNIVQQSLKGSISGRKVVFSGINYTFVQQNEKHKDLGYQLDSYELLLSNDNNQMRGQHKDTGGFSGEIVFEREPNK